MNQIFRITIGQETLNGKLPSVRVGQGYCSLFYISGVSSTVRPPKVWVSANGETFFWEAVWSELEGVWICEVGNSVTENAGGYMYAVTMNSKDDALPEYIAGQGHFIVYTNITNFSGTPGSDGQSFASQFQALWDSLNATIDRLTAIESVMTAGAALGMFDPDQAYDYEFRNQVKSITNILRGYVPVVVTEEEEEEG